MLSSLKIEILESNRIVFCVYENNIYLHDFIQKETTFLQV